MSLGQRLVCVCAAASGATCACSETLDTTRYSSDGTNFDPSNSTAKQCGTDGDYILAGGGGNEAYLKIEDEVGFLRKSDLVAF